MANFVVEVIFKFQALSTLELHQANYSLTNDKWPHILVFIFMENTSCATVAGLQAQTDLKAKAD